MTLVRQVVSVGVALLSFPLWIACGVLWLMALGDLWKPGGLPDAFGMMLLFVLPPALVLTASSWAIWPARRGEAVEVPELVRATRRLGRVGIVLVSLAPLLITMLASLAAWTTVEFTPATSGFGRQELTLQIGMLVIFAGIVAAFGIARAAWPRASGATFWRAIAFTVYTCALLIAVPPTSVIELLRAGIWSLPMLYARISSGLLVWSPALVASVLLFALSFARRASRRAAPVPAGPSAPLTPRPEAS